MSLNQICTINTNALTNLNIGCNDLQVTCSNGDLLSLKPPTHGTQGQMLVSDGLGGFEFKSISAGSGNSNYYQYRKDAAIIVPPSQQGKLNFNNLTQQLATHIYINHRDETKTDIDFYLAEIIPTDFIYIQDRTNSQNWCKFLVQSTVLYPNDYIDITVSFVSGEGTGLSDFGSNHEIFWSVLSNTPAIQARLDVLEDKTEYQSTPTLNQTNFSGTLEADTIKKSSGTNTQYLLADGSVIDGIYNLSSVGSGQSLVNLGVGSDFKTKSLIAGSNITLNSTSDDITISSSTIQSTLSSVGFGYTLINPTSTFPDFKLKGILAGQDIGITPDDTDLILTNLSPASLITINSSGVGLSLVNTNLTSNPNLYLKSIISNTGISIANNTNDLTITNSSPASSINITNAGAGNSLLSSNTNPSFTTKGLLAGTNMSITSSSTDLTLSPDLTGVVLKAGDVMTGQLTVPALVINTGTVINSVPYINNNSQLVSNQSNLYCQAGLDNLQVILNNLVTSQNYSVQLSSGTHNGNIQIIGENKTLSGALSPLFQQTSIITGNLTIGNQSILTTRIRLNNIQIQGNLIFTNDSVFQGLRTYVSNCSVLGSTLQLPTSSVSGNEIYFFDCNFNQNFTVQNTTSPIYFIRCNFNGFTITNNLLDLQYLTFEDCKGLSSLSLGNCILYGMNKTVLDVSQLTSSQLSLSGTNQQYIKGTGAFHLDTSNYRYTSWGYVQPSTITVVDCPTSIMTNLGGSLSNFGINSALAAKGYKIRVGSVVPNTSNGSTSGWLGTATLNYILPKAGWYIKIGFSLDSQTSTAAGNRTMIGLFQSTTRPTLDNTITIASVLTGSMGIVQEKSENFFSFNTRGTTGSTKVITAISCSTPNNNWYTLEMYNEPFSLDIKMILTCQLSTGTLLSESITFTCGGANTMQLLTSYVHLQQSMASPGGINNSALLTLGNITIKLAQ